MKKMMMAMMAAAVMMTGATALAATPDRAADCRDQAPCFETSYACGGGYYGRGHRGRGSYGCGGYGRGGYCYDFEDREG